MNGREIVDLAAAWVILSLAFANLLGGLGLEPFLFAFVTAGVGFLLHELAHRIVARNFGLGAHFEADYSMLGFALLLSFAGFIFAAPGAVYTEGPRSSRQQTLISAAGPITNILLAVAFFFVPGTLGDYGFQINSWLALFNMIPFGGLDGQSVFRNNKILWIIIVGVAAVFTFLL